MPSLLVVSGPNQGDYYPLGTRTVVIGRAEGCSIQVNDDRVSRKHVQLRAENGSYIALDMKSANGTRINGRAVADETVLADLDELELGSSKIVFTTADFPDRASAFDHWKQRGQRNRPTIEQH
jgi:pSer/pThr/pTyr-binding forkhead associated (FHA) protein